MHRYLFGEGKKKEGKGYHPRQLKAAKILALDGNGIIPRNVALELIKDLDEVFAFHYHFNVFLFS